MTNRTITRYDHERKLAMLARYSDIATVRRIAAQKLGSAAAQSLDISNRQDKKYKIMSPQGVWIHFGYWGSEDYTKSRSDSRRQAFLRRNHKWADQDVWTPGWMAYHLLW